MHHDCMWFSMRTGLHPAWNAVKPRCNYWDSHSIAVIYVQFQRASERKALVREARRLRAQKAALLEELDLQRLRLLLTVDEVARIALMAREACVRLGQYRPKGEMLQFPAAEDRKRGLCLVVSSEEKSGVAALGVTKPRHGTELRGILGPGRWRST